MRNAQIVNFRNLLMPFCREKEYTGTTVIIKLVEEPGGDRMKRP
jgi:hypothetical protein